MKARSSAVKSTGITYTPLDMKLEWPRVRILRAIRHFEWIAGFELLDTYLQLPRDEEAIRNAYFVMIGRLHRGGFLDRRDTRVRCSGSHGWARQRLSMGSTKFEYRITESGRRELARLLTTDMRIEWAPLRESEAECA